MKHLILIPLFKLHYFPTVDEWKMKNKKKTGQNSSLKCHHVWSLKRRQFHIGETRCRWTVDRWTCPVAFFRFLFVEFPYRTERWWGFYFNNSPVIIILSPTPEMIRRKINEERSSTENNSAFFLFPSFSHWNCIIMIRRLARCLPPVATWISARNSQMPKKD